MPLNLADPQKLIAADSNLNQEDICEIKEWAKDEEHLPELLDLHIILFLKSCKYSVEVAKETIDKFFTMRTHNPYYFLPLTAEEIRQTLVDTYTSVLPKYTPEGYMIVTNLIETEAKHYNYVNHSKFGDMCILRHLYQYGTPKGLTVIVDLERIVLGHLFQINLLAVRKIMSYFQETIPVEIKSIHLINLVPITQKIITFFKPFMKKELVDMIQCHDNLDSLYKCIPKELLPSNYGGDAGNIQELCEEAIVDVTENMDFFEWHASLKVDETKRKQKKGLWNKFWG